MFPKKNYFYSILIIVCLCKLFYWFAVFPNPDEAYYWLWGRFPDYSYHDHPALQALTQNIFTNIFGASLFSLRLPVFICCVIITYVFVLLFKKLQFKNYSLYLLLFFSSPLFYLFTSFAWNDYVLLTNCLVSGYFFLNFLHDVWLDKKGKSKDIFLGSLFFGLAIISKYNAIFLGLGILSLLISTKKFHSIFKDFRLYISLLLIFLVSSPILLWNSKNKFGSFQFNLQQRTIDPFLNYEFFKGNYAGFIFGSLIMLSPFIWWGIVSFFRDKNLSDKSTFTVVYYKFAKHIFLVSSITFLFLSIFSNVLYYWNIVGLLFITPIGIHYIVQKKKAMSALVFSTIVIIGITVHFGIVPLTSVFGGQDQDSTYHYGWNTVKNTISKHQENLQDPILASSYRNASLLAFALDNSKVYSYSSRFDQFDYWTKNLNHTTNTTSLILTDDRSPLNKELQKLFSEIQLLDTIKINKYNYPIKEYYLYKGIFK
ncbi:Dolichyl-phosphate-mannose-protein mannosyltransferase [Tenacibaculum sp. 190524A02b]